MRSSRSFSKRVALAALALAIGSGAAAAGRAPTANKAAGDPHLIRVWGYTGLSGQLLRWEAEYGKLHPEVRFENQLHAPAAVMAGLYNGVADVALMGREIWPVDTMAYRWVYQQVPFGVIVATAGLQAPGQMFTPVVVVNAKNPIAAITVSQLDAIYGCEHRAAPANIRTWGDLGVKGEWGDQPIHPYGFGGEDALGVYFRQTVLRMDFKPNPESHLLSDRDGGKGTAAERIAEAVAADPYGIGYTSAPHGWGTKVLPVGAPEPVEPSADALSTHEYPLTRSVWVYFRRVPDEAIDPKVDAFVRFLLSARAQAAIEPADELIPLTRALMEKQVQKLDNPMPKAAEAEENPR